MPPDLSCSRFLEQDFFAANIVIRIVPYPHPTPPARPPPGAAASVSVGGADTLGLGMSSHGSATQLYHEQSSSVPPQLSAPQLKRASSMGASSLGLSDEVVHRPDPYVPVFNISVDIVKKCLWKGQVGRKRRSQAE